MRAPVIPAEKRISYAANLAKSVGWHEQILRTSSFILKAYGPRKQRKSSMLTIYIDGDGFAFRSAETPSDNPTPLTPVGLQMAVHDHKHHPVAYLARPCQFVLKNEWTHCRQAYWTNLRFSPEVIHAMNEAVSALKKHYHAQKIILIGYSGGGSIAALIAAKRNDVARLITVAAILDTKQWVKQESLTPLYGSLNPADAWKNLISIPQTHWVGGKDTIAPKEVAFVFAKHFPLANKPEVKVIPDFDHACCWVEKSPYLQYS